MDTPEKSEEGVEEIHQPLLGAKYITIERRSPHDTVFLVDDVPFRSSMPQPTHWSIAWSDLMMTMFVLFLSMFVYKAANQDLLSGQGLEVIDGDISAALEPDLVNLSSPPFSPISPMLPLMTGGAVRKSESITLRDIEVDAAFSRINEQTEIAEEIVEVPTDRVSPQAIEELQTAIIMESPGKVLPGQVAIEPHPLTVEEPRKPDRIHEIYRLSKKTVETNNLRSFATIDLISDNTMRIILTGDLLFVTGQARLTEDARVKLEQLATGIQTTPYIINIVGHTDNVPMYSDRYPSNWELSVARASTVARFLIEDVGMNPNQFVVSGYSSYRPLVENSSVANRKKNRRVEIIISRRLPNPVATGRENLN